MRSLLIACVLAGCWTSDIKPTTTPIPTPTRAPVARRPAIDWPVLIGTSERDARRAIAQLLELDEGADLEPHGVEIYAKNQRTDTIFIHIQPERDGKPSYRGPLFRGITATMTRADLIRLFGEPDERGANDFWIKYRRPEAQIHFQFAGDQIHMITLMGADWTPGS
jgi:hypothetical protein